MGTCDVDQGGRRSSCRTDEVKLWRDAVFGTHFHCLRGRPFNLVAEGLLQTKGESRAISGPRAFPPKHMDSVTLLHITNTKYLMKILENSHFLSFTIQYSWNDD